MSVTTVLKVTSAKTERPSSGFLHEPAQAAVWGVVLRGGESRDITNVRLGDRTSMALAAGDIQARNLRLSSKVSEDQSVGRRLTDDHPPRPLAGTSLEPESGDTYTITLTNAAQDGPAAFSLFGVVQVHDPARESPAGRAVAGRRDRRWAI